MTTTTTARASWPTLTIAELAAHAPAAQADADLIASVRETGIEDPLYVATTSTGAVRIVDGARRFAAAIAAELTAVPVTYRPVIRVGVLTAHPANVRKNLKITKQFRASIAERMATPISVTRTDGGLRIVDGHRRLAAALAEKVTHVPYEYVERDEAAQMLDMVTTAVHREGITGAEEAAALFAAEQLGADARQLATASGRSQKDARTMARIGGSASVAAVIKTARDYEFDLADMAALVELEARSPEAADRVRQAVAADPKSGPYWTIRNEAARLDNRDAADAHRAKLEESGARIRTTAEMSEKAAPVSSLRGVTDHSKCQGDVWTLESGDRRYVRYCSNPPFFGHEIAATPGKQTSGERKRIITGGTHWDAAETGRREWLAAIVGSKSHPKAQADQFTAIAARVMLGASHVIASWMNGDKANAALAQILGIKDAADRRALSKRADTASRRNPAHLFAVVAAAYEAYMPRTTWRTDGDHGRSKCRKPAAQYLTWLTELGYQPSPIESAVIAGETYDPAAPATAAPDDVEE